MHFYMMFMKNIVPSPIPLPALADAYPFPLLPHPWLLFPLPYKATQLTAANESINVMADDSQPN